MTPSPTKMIIQIFNGGVIDLPDATNPRGYRTCYQPETAMDYALLIARLQQLSEFLSPSSEYMMKVNWPMYLIHPRKETT